MIRDYTAPQLQIIPSTKARSSYRSHHKQSSVMKGTFALVSHRESEAVENNKNDNKQAEKQEQSIKPISLCETHTLCMQNH